MQPHTQESVWKRQRDTIMVYSYTHKDLKIHIYIYRCRPNKPNEENQGGHLYCMYQKQQHWWDCRSQIINNTCNTGSHKGIIVHTCTTLGNNCSFSGHWGSRMWCSQLEENGREEWKNPIALRSHNWQYFSPHWLINWFREWARSYPTLHACVYAQSLPTCLPSPVPPQYLHLKTGHAAAVTHADIDNKKYILVANFLL